MAKYRILSLDGGGLRGVISAQLLQRLNEHPQIAGWLAQVDLLAGTSTGGILALGLAAGRTPKQIADLYLQHGAEIFDDSIWDNIRDLGKTIGAEYATKPLKKVLDQTFGELRLAELSRKVAIPTFDLDNGATTASRSWKPKIFHNFGGSDCDAEARVADVALYTSAAPTYFPSADGYIDGGVYANNPAIVGLVQAISQRNLPQERAALDEVVLLSVGTGISLTYIKGKTLDWGYAQWIKPLINILMDGVSGIADYQAQQLLGARYQRLQLVFGKGETIALDAVDKLPRMLQLAESADIDATVEWLKQYWLT